MERSERAALVMPTAMLAAPTRVRLVFAITADDRLYPVAVDAYEALIERAELTEDVRVAEAQLAAGQGIAHGKAQALVLARLRAPAITRKRTA